MPPTIVRIVGKSGSGKTTLIEHLLAEFKQKGCRVANIKHAAHDFELDKEGKDSWRYAEAGSEALILSSPQRVALFKRVDRELTLGELSHLLGIDFDLILAEGFRQSEGLKIEVHRKGLGELLCQPEELVALVTDEPWGLDMPQFSPDNVSGLAEFIETNLMSRRDEEIALFVNGEPISTNPFVQEFIGKTVCGMISVLKGVAEAKSIDISIRRKV
jgi:molybdopterin-guanine dinucleotide biosynthesis protein B